MYEKCVFVLQVNTSEEARLLLDVSENVGLTTDSSDDELLSA